MTTTVALANMPSSPTDVSVNFLNQANLKQRSFSVSAGGVVSSEYVYAAGDPTTETSVLVSVTPNTKENFQRIAISIKTVQTVTVDSVVTEVAPIVASLAITIPGASEDTAKVLAMIGTLYSLTFNGVTSKVPNTGTIDSLNRGIVSNLFG
uniref:Uncharacterized protein n=1 Tax=Leviviridae sp. TaxID=2027243 RepID=A0A514D360_9VIRU|nr:MAG: hypothetical protein H1RhizoL31940e2067_000002 [Leviviridae sp.]